jgi:hypothetical protein
MQDGRGGIEAMTEELCHQAMIITFPPDDKGIELLYISTGEDLETSDNICISKSKHDKYLLILPHIKDPSEFFPISEEDREKIRKWLE